MGIIFADKAENLQKFPDLLSKVKVMQISPLPDLMHIQELVKVSICPKCGKPNLALLGYEISGNIAAIFSRCKQCLNPIFTFLSEEPPESNDLIIVMNSAKDKSICEQIRTLKCPECNLPLEVIYKRESNDYDIQRLLPAQIRCTKCPRSLRNIVFWDRPEYYYQQALKIVDEVINSSPRAALAFLVSAFETYLQKSFLFQSTSNKFLVERRKVNFQSLDEAKDLYMQFMDLDIKNLVTDGEWTILKKGAQNRHGLIHNAGFNRRFESIEVNSSDVSELRTAITNFVNALTKNLESKALL
jgi:hypothetical protein